MHYICTECKGVSETPGVCTTEGCSKKDHSLVACDCADGLHEEILGESEEVDQCC